VQLKTAPIFLAFNTNIITYIDIDIKAKQQAGARAAGGSYNFVRDRAIKPYMLIFFCRYLLFLDFTYHHLTLLNVVYI
jgi:hypothetical protein